MKVSLPFLKDKSSVDAMKWYGFAKVNYFKGQSLMMYSVMIIKDSGTTQLVNEVAFLV